VPIRLAQCRFRGLAISVAKIKGSPYSIAERMVPELIPVLAVTLATLKRTATSFAEI